MIIKQLVAISMVMTQAAGILWFSKEHKDQEDPLLLAASLDYEKWCGRYWPVMTSSQHSINAQVPLSTKRNSCVANAR